MDLFTLVTFFCFILLQSSSSAAYLLTPLEEPVSVGSGIMLVVVPYDALVTSNLEEEEEEEEEEESLLKNTLFFFLNKSLNCVRMHAIQH